MGDAQDLVFAAVADGQFRKDLYYRFRAAVLSSPPLRNRTEDIPLLVEHFIGLFNRIFDRSVAGVGEGVLDAFQAHDWPGNVRELSNVIETAFKTSLESSETRSGVVAQGSRTFAEYERDLIAEALARTGGNKLRAARQLNISRKRLYAKIRKYQLSAT